MGIMGKKRKKMGISKTPSKHRGGITLGNMPFTYTKIIKPSFHEHWEHDFKREIRSKLGYFATAKFSKTRKGVGPL
jgi:hypothetical protein